MSCLPRIKRGWILSALLTSLLWHSITIIAHAFLLLLLLSLLPLFTSPASTSNYHAPCNPNTSTTASVGTSPFFFWLHYEECRILIPWPGIKSSPPAVKARSLNCWTAREVSLLLKYFSKSIKKYWYHQYFSYYYYCDLYSYYQRLWISQVAQW